MASNAAMLTVTPATYTITYDAGAGRFLSDNSSRRAGKSEAGSYTLSGEEPVRDGYVFAGWTLNGEVVTSITVSGDTTVRAKWKTAPYAPASVYWNGYKAAWSAVKGASKYEVTLFRDGVQYGSVLQAAETRLDLQSVLSAQRGAEWTFKTAAVVPDEDGGQEILWPYSDVSAAWVPVYTVTYDAGLGMYKDGSSSRFGTSHAGLYTLFGEEPAREGYFFDGWSLGGIRVTAIQVADDVSVSAVWKLDDTVYPVSVALSETALSLVVGSSAELTAEVLPEDAADPSVTWTTSDPSVATVEDGHVTAVSYGTAVITAVSSNGLTADCSVSVTPVPAYLVAPKTVFMSGSTMVWSPVKNAVGYRVELYLDDALYGTYETEGEAYYNGRLSFSTPVTSDSGTRVLKFRVQAVAYDETYNSAFSAFSEEETIKNTLAKPTGLNFDGVTLSWDPVEHAEYYEVCCQNYSGSGVYTDAIYGTSLPYTSLNATARTSYREYFTVTAYAESYNNSSASERFNISNITPQASDVYAPYNTRFVDGTYGKFSFGYDNPDAWYYVRAVNQTTGVQAGKTLHLTCEAATRAEVSVLDLVSGLGEGDYWISISAALTESAAPGSEITSIAVPWHYTPSAYKLPAPTNLRFMPVDGEICIVWDPVPNASYYKYQGYRDDVRRGYGSTTSYQDYGDFIAMPYFSNPDSITAGTYTFECCAVGDNETTVDSDYSARSSAYMGTPFAEVTVLYDAGEGAFPDGTATRSVTTLEGYVAPINDIPVRVGYTFAGWTVNGAPFAGHTEIHADTTVTAAWDPIDIFYDVTYDAAGGTLNGQASVSVQAAAGRYVLTDAVPVRDGYVFDGWMMDGVLLESDVLELEGPEVITAKWIEAVEPVDGTLVFTLNPAAVRTVENKTVSFHAEVGIDTGDGVVPLPSDGVRFGWQYRRSSSGSWTDIPGAYDDTYRVTAQYGMDDRSYRAIASFDNRQAESAAALLEVDKVLTIVTDLPETVEVREWEEVSIAAYANSWTDAYSLIRIAPDGTEKVLLQSNGHGPRYDFRARLADHGSRYYVLFRLGEQEVRSTVTTLTVNALTERPTSVTISPNKTKLYYSNQNETSDTLIITSNVTGVSGPENLVYVWQVSYDRNDWQSLSASESEDPSVYQMDVMGGSTEYYRLVVNGVASDFVKIQIINRDDGPDSFTYRDILFHGNGGVFPNEAETWYDTTPADVGTYYISTTGSWAIPEPAREGYRFLGWTLAGSDQLVTKATVGSSTIHFYAKWEEAPEGIAITSALFPDENFRDNVAQLYDTDGNGYLSTEEIAEITSIRMSDAGIGSLRGIQYFTSLTSLNCDGNGITDLSVLSGLPITVLDCSANPGIDLSGISGLPLTALYCSDCGLTALDVSSFGDLEILGCRGNSLTELNLLQNPSLRSLMCRENAMTGLDLSGSPLLAGAVNTAAPETRTGGSGREYVIYQLQDQLLEIDAETVITGVPFVITYDANGGTLTADGEQFQHGTVGQYDVVYASGMGEVVFGAEKEGSVFNGWMMPGEIVVHPGDRFPVSESVTLTAQWEVQSSDEIILGWRWADMENGVAVRRTENMPDFVVQMMPGSYCVGEFLYGTADNLTQVDFADLTVDGEILELSRNLNDGCVELYITGYGDCTLTYEGVEMMIISRIPDVAFYTSSTNVGQDTYIMSPWNYDGSVKTVYLVATNGASLNSVTNRCGNDLTITLAQDGSYAEISWTGLNNNWIEVQAAGTWGNGAAFDNSYHVQLNDLTPPPSPNAPSSVTISADYYSGEDEIRISVDQTTMTTTLDLSSEIAGVDPENYGDLAFSWEQSADLINWEEVDPGAEGGYMNLETCRRVAPGSMAEVLYFREVVEGVASNIIRVIFTDEGGYGAFALVYNANGGFFEGGNTLSARSCMSGEAFCGPDGEPYRDGYTLLGWSLQPDGALLEEYGTDFIYEHTTVYAVWGENIDEYTVTYDCSGGEFTVDETVRYITGTAPVHEVLTEAPYRPGYSFTGWYLNGERVSGTIPVTGDMTLVAQWEEDALPTGVEINEANFPDEVFRGFVSANYDTDGDGYLSREEASAVHSINVGNWVLGDQRISTLAGIEHFTELASLNCAGNSGINLSALAWLPLRVLELQGCGLTDLSVITTLTELRELRIPGNNLSSLDLSQNPYLAVLQCLDNFSMTTLDISNNTALVNLVSTTEPIEQTYGQNDEYQCMVYDANGCYLSVNAGVELVTISDFPDVAFFTDNTEFSQDTYIMDAWDYDGTWNTIYLVAQNGAVLDTLVDLDGDRNDLIIDIKPDGSYATVIVRDLYTDWINLRGTGTFGNGEAFDSVFRVRVNDLRTHLFWKEANMAWDEGQQLNVYSDNPDAGPEYRVYTSPGNMVAGTLLYGTRQDLEDNTLEVVNFGDVSIRNYRLQFVDEQGPFVCLRAEDFGSVTLTYQDATLMFEIGLPEIGFYSSTETSEETYLPNVWYCDGTENTAYLVARNGATLSSLTDRGGKNVSFSIAPDGSYAEVTVDSPDGGQICVQTVGVWSDGTPFEMPFGLEFVDDRPNVAAVTAENFPDANFRAFVSDEIDTDGNGILSAAEISGVAELDVAYREIQSLEGIEYFTAVYWLNCDGNQIEVLDVSALTNLVYLSCVENQLTSLNVSNLTILEQLECNDNHLTNLDVTQNNRLVILNCSFNQLTSLDVTHNMALEILQCAENAIGSLDISQNSELMHLSCENNPLAEVDISNHPSFISAVQNGTDSSDDETWYFDGDDAIFAAPKSARILGVTFSVTYDAGDGHYADGTGRRNGMSALGTYTLSGEEPTREGYTFAGWTQDGVNAVTEIEVSGDVVLTALWTEEPVFGWRWADMDNGVAVRRTGEDPQFVVQMMPGSYCVGEFLYGTTENFTQVAFDDITVDGSILELRRNLNDGCVELYITGYGDCTLTYEGVEMMIISRIPDVAFYTSSTNVGQDTYIMSPWNYDGSVKTVYLVATNGASLNSVTNRCGNDLTITLAQDGSYAEISWTGLNNNWIEVQAAGTWGNGAAFDNSYHVQLNDQAQHLYWKSGTISYETGEETFTPDESPLMKEITVPSNSTLIGFVTYGTPGVSMATLSYEDLTVNDENGILSLIRQGDNFVQLNVGGVGTATLSYMGETVTIHSTLPDIAFYTASTASEEYYLPQSQIWAYTDQNRTIYLIARNGAVMTEVVDFMAEMNGTGISGLDISLSADGTVATIQANNLTGSQLVLRVNGTNANGEPVQDYVIGISVSNASPALYWQRAYMSYGEGGAETLSWSNQTYNYAQIQAENSALGRFVYGTAVDGLLTDGMTVIPFADLTRGGDDIVAVTDHGDYLELAAVGYGTGTLSYNGSSVTLYNLLKIDEFNFPDENFRNYIRSNIDTDGDGTLSDGEISPVTTMNLNGLSITTLEGIHLFRNLITLQCAGNSGIDLADLDGLPLENLMCHACGLQGIDLSGLSRLRRFECNGSAFASLDVSQNPDLFKLVCRSEQLVTVYLNSNSALWNLATGTTPQIVTPEQGPQYIQYSGEGETLLEIGTTTTLSGVVIVTYDANGGQFTDGSGDTVKMCSAASGNYLVEYQFNDVSREGYAFTGWYLPEGAEIGPDDVITADGHVTLTAHWSPRPTGVVVTADYFDGDDDDTVYISTDPESGAALTLNSEIQGVSYEDYDGMTWIWEESRDLTEWYEVMLEADDMADLTSFHYHPQTNAVETVYYRETVNGVSSNVLTVSYYTNGSDMPTETYTVTYDAAGGCLTTVSGEALQDSPDTFEMNVTSETVIDIFLAAVREGYTFTGWLLPDGTVISPGDTLTVNGAMTLTAQWEQIDLDNDQEISMDSILAADPAPAEPVLEPVSDEEPIDEEPVVEEPVYEESVVEEPVYEEPVYEEPVYEEPVYEEPVYEEPVYEEPVYEEPVYEEPTYEEPAE